MAYKQTKNLYKTVKDGMVFENKLCGFVSSNFCSTDEVSLGEIFPEGFDSGFEANITESNKSEYVEHKDKSLVEMTIKTYFPPYDALRIMYKGRLDVWEYDGNPTTWTDVLLPERRSTDPGCLTNVFLLPHPFCEVPSLVINHQVGKGNVQALSQGTHYDLVTDPANSHYCIKWKDGLDEKGKITITMSGSVNPGGNFRRSECDQANPFVMKFTSYNSKCATQKEASIYLTDVTAEPFKFTGPTTDEKGMFEFKIRGRIALFPVTTI